MASVTEVLAPPLVPGKGDRTRRRLLEIAVRRFAAEGFRRTSVSQIAREAGLTPAAVYAYFSGKEGLFEAAVDADAEALIDQASAAAADESSLRDGLLVFLAYLRERVHEHPLARRVLSGLEPEVIGRLLELPSLRAVTELVTAGLANGQEAGEVRADVDPRQMAVGLQTVVLSLLMGQLQTGADDPARTDGVIAVLDAALTPPA
jgi:AcrR family transcriptional regulator